MPVQDHVGEASGGVGHRDGWEFLRDSSLGPARSRENAVAQALWNLGSAWDRGVGCVGSAIGL